MKRIPIHTMLLKDGQIVLCGMGNKGRQGAKLYYQVWNWNEGIHRDVCKLQKRRSRLTYSGKRHSQTHKWSWNKSCFELQEAFVIGGAGDGSNSKDGVTKKGSPFPEVYSPNKGFHVLTNTK
eukprot:9212441-Ditylum_brightwellii.AAC.1